MAEYKKQHYVPRLYLRNFTTDNKLLSVYNISQCKTIPSAPYDTQCYKNYYYGKDKIWETQLSKLEAKWGLVFQNILAKKELSREDIYLIKQFALYQLQRTVAMNDYMTQQREELLCEYGRLLYKREGLVFDSNAESYCKERAKNECSPSENLAFTEDFIPVIQDLELTVITYDTRHDLITSDVPVIAINQFYKPLNGYNCMGLIILFPITYNCLVVLYDAKMYPQYKDSQYITSLDEDEVYNLNVLQLASADKILLAKSENSFSFISDKALEIRNMNRSRESTTFLGTDDNRLMVSTPRTIIYNCEFSFGKVCHNFKRIPFVCKEAPPRKWQKEWENKLEMKEYILPDLAAKRPNLFAEYGISKKEIKRGCQRMATAARLYWSQKE